MTGLIYYFLSIFQQSKLYVSHLNFLLGFSKSLSSTLCACDLDFFTAAIHAQLKIIYSSKSHALELNNHYHSSMSVEERLSIHTQLLLWQALKNNENFVSCSSHLVNHRRRLSTHIVTVSHDAGVTGWERNRTEGQTLHLNMPSNLQKTLHQQTD